MMTQGFLIGEDIMDYTELHKGSMRPLLKGLI